MSHRGEAVGRRWFSKHKSGILSALACVGVAVTAALTYLGTIKAIETQAEWVEEKHDELTTFEKVQASAPCLLPAAGAAVATIGCIVTAHKVSKREIAVLAGTAALATRRYDEYRMANIEANGEDAHKKALEKANEHVEPRSILNSAYDVENITFYDTITGQFFDRSMAQVLEAEMLLNREFTQDLSTNVDAWCAFLGIPNRKNDQRGWYSNDEFTWLDFRNSKMVASPDGGEAIVIECAWTPIDDYYDWDVTKPWPE